MAYCERGVNRGLCTIYDLANRKKHRVFPEEHEADYKSKEFIGAAFCPKDPHRYIVTLTGKPDFAVHLWQHDLNQMRAKILLDLPMELDGTIPF